MYYNKMPYGEGIFFEGKYEPDKLYDVYVQMFTCQFELKKNHIPTIQIKHNFCYVATEYLTCSNGDDVTLCLTSVDLKLFFEQYNVYNIEWLHGWKWKSTVGLFKDYIDKWMNVKIESTKNGNKAMRTLAKLMLNALYGKFALNPNVCSKYPVYEDGLVRYELGEKETRDPIYIPVGTFITAYARYKTISSAQKVYKRFIYADTDSLHLVGTVLPKELEIDATKLGAWKHELVFSKARYLRSKTYMEYGHDPAKPDVPDEWKITCAGMPETCYPYVTWENFHVGSSYQGKLQQSRVRGGIVLKDIDFSIK
jgi:hypothetical protein